MEDRIRCSNCQMNFDKRSVKKICSNCFACTGCEVYRCPRCGHETAVKSPKAPFHSS